MLRSASRAARRRQRAAATRRRPWAILLVPLLCGAACTSYVATNQLGPLLADKQYDKALASLRRLDTGTSRLLYGYERGLVLHQANRFVESNSVLDSAETVWEDLYTRSISREAGALLVSEAVREYRGERFEAALLHYYKIMNYLQLGDVEAAAVQSRRLDHRLQVMKDAGGSCYLDDPFLQYLNGMVLERAGEWNEADVSMRKALESYRSLAVTYGVEVPSRLACDLADNALRLGAAEEAKSYRDDGHCPAPEPGTGRLRLFLECGTIAFKQDENIVLPIFKNEIRDDLDRDAYCRTLAARRGQPVPQDVELEYLLRISLPRLVEIPSGIASARIIASAPGDMNHTTWALVGENCTAHARRAFEAEQGTVFLRAVARGLAKYLAKRQAEKKGGEAAGLFVNLFNVVTETADTRCWSTLPDRILLAGLDLPAGTYDLHVELCDAAGTVGSTFDIPNVAIAAERASFLNYRIY
jgi:tetratricopeptide (TPR) repeat protein